MNSFLLNLNHRIGQDTLAEIIDERTGKIGEHLLRITPSGQKKVNELVFKGDLVKTNYSDRVGMVTKVPFYKVYGLDAYTIIYVLPDTTPNKDGNYRGNNLNWINELVAQDGRILHLFVDNKDEVFIEKHGTGQQSLFRYRK